MNESKSKVIIDPVTILPTETFTLFFPFLPISDIAYSSSVSRTWRRTILSDSTLFREVDLTRLDQSENVNVITDIIDHLGRFSSRSLDKLVKVSLNLNSFFWEYQFNNENDVTDGSIALLQTLSRSRDSLQTIFLTITTTTPGFINDQIDFISINLLDSVLGFPNLKKVYIEVDSTIEFQVGEDLPSSKVFSIKDLSNTEADSEPIDETQIFIEAAINFVGLGMTRLSLRESPAGEAVDLIEAHQSTLRSLSLNFTNLETVQGKVHLLRAAASCTQLTDLSMILSSRFPYEEAEGAVPLGLEEGLRCPQLEKLTLEVELNLDWRAWSKWSGNCLKEIIIYSYSSTDPMPLVLNSRLTLHDVSLVSPEAETIDEPNSQPIHFPTLCSITLRVSPSLFRVFSNLVANNLRILQIDGPEESAADSFRFLHSVLERHASNLTHLRLDNVGYESSALVTTRLNFRRLRWLSGYSCHEGLFEWLSHFQYPNLIHCGVSVGKANDEQIKKLFQLNAPNLKFA